MNPLVKAEFCKLTSTRLWLWMLILGVALVVGTTTLAIGFAEPGPLGLDTAAGQRIVFAQATVTLVVAGVLGIIAVTGEFAHQTATLTFLATPQRSRVVQAKFLTYSFIGLAYAAMCTIILLAVAVPWLAAENVHIVLSRSDIARTMGGVGIEVGLYAALGVALGCLVGNQIAAIVGLVVYIFVAGPIISYVAPISGVTKYSPYQAGNSLGQLTASVDVQMLGQITGGLVLLAWVLIFAVLGIRLTVRRDIA